MHHFALKSSQLDSASVTSLKMKLYFGSLMRVLKLKSLAFNLQQQNYFYASQTLDESFLVLTSWSFALSLLAIVWQALFLIYQIQC